MSIPLPPLKKKGVSSTKFLMKNSNKIKYTLNHKKEVCRLYKKCFGYCPFRAVFHDVDKILLLLIGVNVKTASRWHRKFASHHNINTTKKSVLIEMLIDWESARFTKPEKPLNARDTLAKFYPQMSERMSPLLKELKF